MRGADYVAPGRSITAKLEYSNWNLKLGSDGTEVLIPAGQKYLVIGFSPPYGQVHVLKGELGKVINNLEIGCRDYIHFLNTLGQKCKFNGVQVVCGDTNPQLARLAIHKLGFHYNDHYVDIKRQLANPNGYIPIYGIVAELITKIPALQDFYRVIEKKLRV